LCQCRDAVVWWCGGATCDLLASKVTLLLGRHHISTTLLQHQPQRSGSE
jgi:hypothetical protein